jgi:hypothetical protein
MAVDLDFDSVAGNRFTATMESISRLLQAEFSWVPVSLAPTSQNAPDR